MVVVADGAMVDMILSRNKGFRRIQTQLKRSKSKRQQIVGSVKRILLM
jgi:hypothetical protein